MRLLLDTHALVWFYQSDAKLNASAEAAIADSANEIYVSPVNHWGVAIKLSMRKSILNVPFDVFIQEAIFDVGFKILSIEPKHTALLAILPFHHKDPFDRILIAQALAEGLSIVSGDAVFDAYGVTRVW